MSIDEIPKLYHFCDSRNVASIRQHGGIYSREQCQRRGIEIPVLGGDEASQRSDDARGTNRHVHLGFTTNHPMAHVASKNGRIQRVVYVHINRDILTRPDVLFVPGLANSNGIKFYPIQQALDDRMIDFEALYKWLDYRDPELLARRAAVEKYEILVPDYIPIESILYLPNG